MPWFSNRTERIFADQNKQSTKFFAPTTAQYIYDWQTPLNSEDQITFFTSVLFQVVYTDKQSQSLTYKSSMFHKLLSTVYSRRFEWKAC